MIVVLEVLLAAGIVAITAWMFLETGPTLEGKNLMHDPRRPDITWPDKKAGCLAAPLTLLAILAVVAALIWARPSAAQADPPPPGYTIAGLDAHDGTIVQDGSTYYLYGTRYGCGYQYRVSHTGPWCGFGVWQSASPAGPWTFVRLLFDANGHDTMDGVTWQALCGYEGCFNPRMVQRPDGVWILWFNAPADWFNHRANAYYSMGCNGPAGPCGVNAGAPSGGTFKPSLWVCKDFGDFSIVTSGSDAWILCTMANQTVAVEHLASWWGSGDGIGAANLGGLTQVESPGAFRDGGGTWVMTFSDPNCAYCSATATGYTVASSMTGPWSTPTSQYKLRRDISATSCGGQPRTVATINGQPYEWIDLWYDQPNETNAGIRLEPLVPTGQPYLSVPDGTVWLGGLRTFACS